MILCVVCTFLVALLLEPDIEGLCHFLDALACLNRFGACGEEKSTEESNNSSLTLTCMDSLRALILALLPASMVPSVFKASFLFIPIMAGRAVQVRAASPLLKVASMHIEALLNVRMALL